MDCGEFCGSIGAAFVGFHGAMRVGSEVFGGSTGKGLRASIEVGFGGSGGSIKVEIKRANISTEIFRYHPAMVKTKSQRRYDTRVRVGIPRSKPSIPPHLGSSRHGKKLTGQVIPDRTSARIRVACDCEIHTIRSLLLDLIDGEILSD